jgi:hypothetical protein
LADVKISQLPSASTPLAGTEEIPLVQSSTTKKITVSNLLTSANLGTPSAINLANATNVPMAQASGVLPVVNGGSGTATPSIVAGTNVTVSGTWPNQTINSTFSGAVTSVTGTAPVVSSGGTTPAISMAAATTSVNGYLTSTDWTTFNNKLTSGGALGTPSSGTATNLTGLPLSTGVTGLLPVANGGTGTATPALVAGTNVTITGSWPNQTINATNSGTVTSVSGTGTVNGLTLTGTVTTTGSLTLGGTLDLSSPPAIGGTVAAAITGTTITASTKFVGTNFDAAGSGGGGLRTSSGANCLQWGGGGGVNLTLDGAFNMNPANASISIAPTGTGTLTINPATAGTINNMAIGGTTPAAGAFTTLSATSAIAVTSGGTGQTSYTDGQLLIGNSTGNTLTKATLTAGTNVTITNGNGTITIAATGGGGSGDVVGPASSTDNALARFDTTTGKLLQNSVGILSDTGAISGLTDISASGSVTLSGGTANGVTYLNGSKVLTSGSALNFNGTSLAVGDTAASADGSSLYIYGNLPASTQLGIKIGGNANSYTQQAIRFYDTYFGAYAGFLGFTTNSLTFGQGTTEGMRLTSTGLGIGTSSIGEKLVVSGSASVNVYKLRSNTSAPASTDAFIYRPADNTIGFGTGSAEKMRLDSSGNLGLGVTPSATNTSYKAQEIGFVGNGLIGFGANDFAMSSGAYYSSSGWKHSATNSLGASFYEQYTGQHIWYNKTAVSHTAGDAITFTQAMTLDASGNLFLGVTSSAAGRLAIKDVAGSGNNIWLVGRSSDGTSSVSFRNNADTAYNARIECFDTGIMTFGTGTSATERARIDSSGNLLVNSTSTLNAVFSVTAKSGISACSLRVETDGDYGYTFKNASNTFVGAIGVNSSSTSYVTSSDYRLKNTIAPMTGALAKVALLKPVTYKWNVDGADSQGFIAHELAEVVPECVTGEKDAIDAEGNPIYQGIDTSFLVATLTSALQELNAKFEAYVASHP